MKFYKTLIISILIFQGAAEAQQFYIRPAFKLGQLNAPEYQYTIDYYDWNTDTFYPDTTSVSSAFTFTVSAGVSIDLHLHKFSNEMSLGLQSSPTFGFYIPTNEDYFDGMGVPFVRSIPVYAQFNYGVFSTPESESEHGVGIGLGVHYLSVNNKNISEPWRVIAASPTSWVMPSARLSYRFWNVWNTLSTLNITYSMSGASNSGVNPNFRQQYLDFSMNWQLKY